MQILKRAVILPQAFLQCILRCIATAGSPTRKREEGELERSEVTAKRAKLSSSSDDSSSSSSSSSSDSDSDSDSSRDRRQVF